MATLGCGSHRAYVFRRGGKSMVMELPDPMAVRWERVRDEVSTASVVVPVTPSCCGQLGSLETVTMELHIYRDNEPVWQGPITRLEWNIDTVELWATDILWVAKHTALSQGYTNKYPNIGRCGARMNWLMKDMTFAKHGDPWNAVAGVRWIYGPDEPRTSKTVNAWSCTTWDDFDAFAEDSGMDYTVMGRSVMFWDVHHRWMTLPTLRENYLTGPLRVVEYGSEFQTRAVVTNGEGQAGVYTQTNPLIIGKYGYVDSVLTEDESDKEEQNKADIAAWTSRAKSIVDSAPVPPVNVLVPANTGLLPEAPYSINSLIPGAWLQVRVDNLCRKVTDEWHKLDRVYVTQEGGVETVAISTSSAPLKMVT
jgi:hypothetical protein